MAGVECGFEGSKFRGFDGYESSVITEVREVTGWYTESVKEKKRR